MSFVHRISRLSAVVALATALSACQAPVPVTPDPSPDAAPAIIKGRLDLGTAHAYRTQYHETVVKGMRLLKSGVQNAASTVGKGAIYVGKQLTEGPKGETPDYKPRVYELLAGGETAEVKELMVQPDGSWQIEVPAGPVTLKLLLGDGTMLPLSFPSGADAAHWMKVESGKTYDLGLLTVSGENKGASEHNPLMHLDTDGDGTPDAEDLDDDGDGTPDTEETGAMRYDAAETADTDRDGVGDNSDPSPTDAGFRGAENLEDGDGDGIFDPLDLDGDGKLDVEFI